MGKPILVANGGGSKIGVKNNGCTFGGKQGIGQFLFSTGGFGGGGGGVNGVAVPRRWGAVGERHDCLLNNS